MEKKHIAVNTQLIISLLLFFVFLSISICCAIENEVGLCVMFAVFLLLPIFLFAISPLYFVFSSKEVEIVYNFGQKENIEWSNIRSISVMGNWVGGGGGLPHYVIAYSRKQKQLFFVVGEIPKTRKTTKLIKKYYNKQIV